MGIIIYLTFYSLILFSILGHGYIFKKCFFAGSQINFGYQGYLGLFFLTFISYFSSFFTSHNLVFNTIILLIGLFGFIFYLFLNFHKIKKDLSLILLIFILLIVFILTAKNHDDFPYYHFSYIHLLTTSTHDIGIGNFNHGFRTPSSIFYLSSLFYLPKVNYDLIHILPTFF